MVDQHADLGEGLERDLEAAASLAVGVGRRVGVIPGLSGATP